MTTINIVDEHGHVPPPAEPEVVQRFLLSFNDWEGKPLWVGTSSAYTWGIFRDQKNAYRFTRADYAHNVVKCLANLPKDERIRDIAAYNVYLIMHELQH